MIICVRSPHVYVSDHMRWCLAHCQSNGRARTVINQTCWQVTVFVAINRRYSKLTGRVGMNCRREFFFSRRGAQGHCLKNAQHVVRFTHLIGKPASTGAPLRERGQRALLVGGTNTARSASALQTPLLCSVCSRKFETKTTLEASMHRFQEVNW